MRQDFAVVAIPDLTALSPSSILQAALYFDVIYADHFSAWSEGWDEKKHSLQLRLKSEYNNIDYFAELKAAGVIQPVSLTFKPVLPSVSGHKLPIRLRRLVAQSLKEGAALLPLFLTAILEKNSAKEEFKSSVPPSIEIKDAANLKDSKAEIQIITQLLMFLVMLNACSSNRATPFVDHPVQADLLAALAKYFRSMSRSLGYKEISTLVEKQNSLAIRILQETLPDLRVNHPEDVLHLRELLKDELLEFRGELGKLATTIRSNTWDASFAKEVDSVIASQVKPALADLRSKLRNPSKRILKHLVSDWQAIAGGASVPLSAFVMQSAELPWALLAGICSGLGIAALKAKVEEWSVKRDSPLTFLIESERKLRN